MAQARPPAGRTGSETTCCYISLRSNLLITFLRPYGTGGLADIHLV